jgi:glutathione S-transferase
MQLIGMLDSPYVRRSALGMRFLDLSFEHRSVSVFRHFDEFASINPVVKAPTLVCDDGSVLMDSSLILALAADLAAPRSLLPQPGVERVRAYRITGLALAACEKCISIVYEHELRPADKRHAPWLDRVNGQLRAACAGIEAELQRGERVRPDREPGITAAVTWRFLRFRAPEISVESEYPTWAALSAEAERMPEYMEFDLPPE